MSKLPEHLFVSSVDGSLHDTRTPAWVSREPLRATYQRHYPEIKTVARFKATLRAGAYAWPGGYPLFFICSDGGALCFDCAHKQARQIMPSIATQARDGWNVVACDVNWEDSELTCDHCNEQIESAYGD